MAKQLLLILGGARAGKSAFAQKAAASTRRVLFVATAQAGDEDMVRRIADHKATRPTHWDTLEEPRNLPAALAHAGDGYDVVLIDCVTFWVSNLVMDWEGQPGAEARILEAVQRLVECYDRGSATWIVVSNEVGLGVVPPTELGRAFRDVLGRVNQLLAAHATQVYWVTAGLGVELKALASAPRIDRPPVL